MAAIFRRRSGGDRLDPATLERMAHHHLLLLPAGDGLPDIVATLVRSRIDDAELDLTGTARLGRRSQIAGPFDLGPADLGELDLADRADLADLADLHGPDASSTAYLLEAPVERDPDGFEAFVDPVETALWMRAFPDGPPYREEGALVGLGIDLARRLGGALRIAGTGIVMRPDPGRNVELTVWSPYWVAPEDLVALVGPVLPGARLDAGRPHEQPPENPDLPWSVDPLDPFAEDLQDALTPELLQRLEHVADATDAWAAQEMALADGYAVVGDGGIVIGVQVETVVPDWVLRQLGDLPDVPTDRLVTYDIRWWPQDLSQLHIENPNPAHRIARQLVGATIRDVARVTSEAVYGVVVDASGFHMPPDSLI
jgi:hypothetical protein